MTNVRRALARIARHRPSRSTVDRDRGAAAIEFALVMPMLLLLVFGIVGYGYMLSFRQNLSQSAGEGARAAATTLLDSAKISNAQQALNSALSANSVSCDGTAPTTYVTGGTGTFSGTLNKTSNGTASAAGICTISWAPCAVGSSTSMCLTVGLVYNYRSQPMVPAIPGVGLVLPATLTYTAVSRVN